MGQLITIINNKIKRCLLSEVRPLLTRAKVFEDITFTDIYLDVLGNEWVLIDDDDKIIFYYPSGELEICISDLKIVSPNKFSKKIDNGWYEWVSLKNG